MGFRPSTGEANESKDQGLVNLASSVIAQALKDYMQSGMILEKRGATKREKIYAEVTHMETTNFLHGRSEIARHWFTCAGIGPFTREMLRRYRMGEIA